MVNDMGPCGTYGDIHSDFLPDVLRKYYTHSFTDLEFITIKHNPFGYESTSDTSLDDDEAEDRLLEYWLSQECTDKSILTSINQREFGMGCSCSASENKRDFRDREIVCIIAVAREVETKDIRERIPGFGGLYDNENSDWKCKNYCHQLPFSVLDDLYNYSRGSLMTTEWCADGERPDENHYCKQCSEITPGCSECYEGKCFLCKDESGYKYPPFESSFLFTDSQGGRIFNDYTSREILQQSCKIPDCFAGASSTPDSFERCAICPRKGINMLKSEKLSIGDELYGGKDPKPTQEWFLDNNDYTYDANYPKNTILNPSDGTCVSSCIDLEPKGKYVDSCDLMPTGLDVSVTSRGIDVPEDAMYKRGDFTKKSIAVIELDEGDSDSGVTSFLFDEKLNRNRYWNIKFRHNMGASQATPYSFGVGVCTRSSYELTKSTNIPMEDRDLDDPSSECFLIGGKQPYSQDWTRLSYNPVEDEIVTDHSYLNVETWKLDSDKDYYFIAYIDFQGYTANHVELEILEINGMLPTEEAHAFVCGCGPGWSRLNPNTAEDCFDCSSIHPQCS